ncbi:MAG: sugar phosphate isomerase/epimerase [Firmicutes bacterium]|nr:sugar phosphate isomerase/epimerase [Bacillota bacterium]
MRIGLSTYLFVGQPLQPALLEEIVRAGFNELEIFCVRSHFDYRNAETVRTLAGWFADHNLKLHALHAPTSREISASREGSAPLSISDLERVRRIDAMDEIKRVLEVAERLPFRYLVQHVGAGREPADPRKFDALFHSLEHLVLFAKQRGVTIALENTPGEFSSPTSLRHFLEDTRLRELRFCFDVGHAHMEEGVSRSFEVLHDGIATTHIHDNHGEKDEHLLPFEGTVDWPAALERLASLLAAQGGVPLVFELKESAVPHPPLEHVCRAREKLLQACARAGSG